LVGGFHASGRLSLFLELHNPGPDDLRPIYYIPPSSLLSAEGAANLTNFMAAGAADLTGPLVLSETQVVMNSGYHPLWQSISINWASALPGDAFGACLEVPWNTVHSTPGGYMQVGEQQGLAIERYLRTAW